MGVSTRQRQYNVGLITRPTLASILISCTLLGSLSSCAIRPTLLNVPENIVSKRLQKQKLDPTSRIVHRIKCETRHAIATVSMEFLKIELDNLEVQKQNGELDPVQIAALDRIYNEGIPSFEKLINSDNYNQDSGIFARDLVTLPGLESDLPSLAAFADIKIGFGFRFELTETNNASKGAANFKKIFSRGSKTIGFTGGYTRSRVNKRNFSIVQSIKDIVFDTALLEDKCSEHEFNQQKNWHFPIYGAINIQDSIRTFSNLTLRHGITGKKGSIDSGKAAEYSDLITFTTQIDGGINPSITLNPISHGFNLISSSLGLSAQRMDVHELNLVLLATKVTQDVLTKIENDLYRETVANR